MRPEDVFNGGLGKLEKENAELKEELARITEIAEMRLERAGWHHKNLNRLSAHAHALECQIRRLGAEPVKPRIE